MNFTASGSHWAVKALTSEDGCHFQKSLSRKGSDLRRSLSLPEITEPWRLWPQRIVVTSRSHWAVKALTSIDRCHFQKSLSREDSELSGSLLLPEVTEPWRLWPQWIVVTSRSHWAVKALTSVDRCHFQKSLSREGSDLSGSLSLTEVTEPWRLWP